MGVFKYRNKGKNVYYAGFGVGGQYFVRSTGTSNRREAVRKEKKLRALAEAGRLPLKVSAEERAETIRKSLAIPIVSRTHRSSVRAAAKKRDEDPEARKSWIAAIKAGQDDPEVKARMSAASKQTAADPVSKRRKRRSLIKAWKRPGHRTRVSKSITKTLATPESKERRRAGRERWAKRLLGLEIAKSPNKRGRPAERTEVLRQARDLQNYGFYWSQIARWYEPDFEQNPRGAAHRIKVGVNDLKKREARVRPAEQDRAHL